jgi:hypothetical protein|tara:strand:+ start:205 stop:408 length:204 start_codon:yes stop_codon:yes gene_type:complete
MHDAVDAQASGQPGYPRASKALLDAQVKGTIIHFPSQFAREEVLKGGGTGANKNAVAETFTQGEMFI